jgi:hypothetical protein
MTYAVVGHAGEIAVGRTGSPGGSHRPSGVASCRHRAVYEQKKVPVLRLLPPISRGAAAGVRSNTFIVPLFLTQKGIPQPAAGLFELAEAGHRLSLTSRRCLLDFSAICRPGYSHRSVLSFEGPETPPARAAGSGDAGNRFEVQGRPRPGLLRPGSPGWGLPAPGQPRVAVHENEDGGPDRETDHSDQPQRQCLR